MKKTLLAHVATRAEEEIIKHGCREPTPFERMKELTRRIVAIPKSEIGKKARRKYQAHKS